MMDGGEEVLPMATKKKKKKKYKPAGLLPRPRYSMRNSEYMYETVCCSSNIYYTCASRSANNAYLICICG